MIIKASQVIRIQDGCITDIGDGSLLKKYSRDKVISLDALILYPGFINAHCHLDLTALGPLKPREFTAWIRAVVSGKNAADPVQVAKGIESGIQALLKSGVTAVGDHIGFNTDPTPILNSPLKGILFGEVLGLVPEVAQDIYQALKIRKMDSRFHISPHSVHAVNPEVLAQVIRENAPPLSCHLAESEPEEKYFLKHRGSLAEFVRERGLSISHRGTSGLDFLLEQKSDISKLLIIHGNYLTDRELDLVAKNKISIVHCPGSHAHFGHKPFPLKKCRERGINVALGTDSIASNTTLDFLSELKLLKKEFPFLTPDEVLSMATLNGAKALRMENEIGSLSVGKKADIIGLPAGQNFWEATIAGFVMIDGRIVIGPGFPLSRE